MAAHFTYGERLNDNQIRLVRIHPSDDEHALRCDIVTSDLDSATQYNALSYAWGTSTSRKGLMLNGQKAEITSSLYGALMRYKSSKRAQLLWADAICINQEDSIEKTQQVRIMKTIYEKADLVIIWLGDELSTDAEGLDLAKIISDLVEKDKDKTDILLDATDYDASGIPSADSPSWRSLMLLYSRPWFQRVWIVQEFVCGRDCVMWCGTLEFEPQILMQPARQLVRHWEMSKIVASLQCNNLVNEIGALWLLKDSIGQGKTQGMRLQGLLWLTLAFQATEMRDKVFALVGLADDVSPSFIDYQLSLHEVFVGTALFIIHENAKTPLQILSLVRGHNRGRLPSWVPDWIQNPYGQTPLVFRYRNGIPSSELLQPPPEIEFSNDGVNVLSVRGKLIDSISSLHLSPYANPGKTIQQTLATFIPDLSAWLSTCGDVVRASNRYKTEVEETEALWRTIIFDTTLPSGFGVPDATYAASYKAYRDLIDLELSVEAVSDPLYKQQYSQSLEVQSKRALYTSQSRAYQIPIGAFNQGRQFFSTNSGYFGWAPLHTELNDKICIFQGYPLPFVIRPTPLGDFELVGDAYVHGLMEGEAMRLADSRLEMIRLV